MKNTQLTRTFFMRFSMLLALVFATTATYATETINKTLDASANSLIEIKHVSGKARVIGWDKNQVKVEGELGDKTEEFIFERDGKSVVIEVRIENQGSNWNWGNSNASGDDLVIYVPSKSRVHYHSPNAELIIENVSGGADIEMINGDLRASNLAGKMNLKTVNGDISGKKLSGGLVIEAVNGDIKVDHIKGTQISVNTVNGDINASSIATDVNVETVNGDIEFTLDDVNEVKAHTVNGDIAMDMNLTDGASVRASSVGGGINFAFQDGVQAKFDLEAHAGGNIKNNITKQSAEKAKYGPRRWLAFSTGEPNARVDASTVNGKIVVRTRN